MRDVCLAPVSCLVDLISGKKRAGRGVFADRASLEQPLNISTLRFRQDKLQQTRGQASVIRYFLCHSSLVQFSHQGSHFLANRVFNLAMAHGT